MGATKGKLKKLTTDVKEGDIKSRDAYRKEGREGGVFVRELNEILSCSSSRYKYRISQIVKNNDFEFAKSLVEKIAQKVEGYKKLNTPQSDDLKSISYAEAHQKIAYLIKEAIHQNNQELAIRLINFRTIVLKRSCDPSLSFVRERLEEYGASEEVYLAINKEAEIVLEELIANGEYINIVKMQSYLRAPNKVVHISPTHMISYEGYSKTKGILEFIDLKIASQTGSFNSKIRNFSFVEFYLTCSRLLKEILNEVKIGYVKEESMVEEYYFARALPYKAPSLSMSDKISLNELKYNTLIKVNALSEKIKIDTRLVWRDCYRSWVAEYNIAKLKAEFLEAPSR
jgi:hypothetical protein